MRSLKDMASSIPHLLCLKDDEYEYRHVHVTKDVAKLVPRNRLMSESEWRSLGIQ